MLSIVLREVPTMQLTLRLVGMGNKSPLHSIARYLGHARSRRLLPPPPSFDLLVGVPMVSALTNHIARQQSLSS